jgi:hypothetical protein
MIPAPAAAATSIRSAALPRRRRSRASNSKAEARRIESAVAHRLHLREVRAAIAARLSDAEDADEDELAIASNAAAELVRAGKLDEAEQAARDLLVRFPDVHDGYDRLGMVYEARGNNGQACRLLSQSGRVHQGAPRRLRARLRGRVRQARESPRPASRHLIVPFIYPGTSDAEVLEYQNLQKSLHDQMTLNYKAQIESFDSKIKQTEATIAKYEADAARYGEREQIAKQIEGIRLDLEAKGAGSLLNRLTTQDQRLEMLRFQQFGYNSLAEARSTLTSTKSDREAFVQKWLTDISQELVKARGDLGTASAQLEKALKKQDLVRLAAAERSVVLTVAKLSVGSVLKEGDTLFTLTPSISSRCCFSVETGPRRIRTRRKPICAPRSRITCLPSTHWRSSIPGGRASSPICGRRPNGTRARPNSATCSPSS